MPEQIPITNLDDARHRIALLDIKFMFRPQGRGASPQIVTVRLADSFIRDAQGRAGCVFYDEHLYDTVGFELPAMERSTGKSQRIKIELNNPEHRWFFIYQRENGLEKAEITIRVIEFDFTPNCCSFHDSGHHPSLDLTAVDRAKLTNAPNSVHLAEVARDFPPCWWIRNPILVQTEHRNLMNVKELSGTKCTLELGSIRESKDTIPPYVLEDFCIHTFRSEACGYAGPDKSCGKSKMECINKGNACRYVGGNRAR